INIWLDDPYDMVGPLNFQEFLFKEKIEFEACIVMTKKRWQKEQILLKKESYYRQQKIYQEFKKESKNYNNQSQEKHRKLLCLPLEGKLEIAQIKTAYRKIAKVEHPDIGGSHERFILITEAKDALLLIY
ncbi:MAG: J domain-containing protein, partial [Campylobacterota bacterium]|nr:J domain-containing protein [Campylobacterota bacterium]